MKVGMYYNNRDVRVEEQDRPEVGDGDLLVKIMASGICGSDIMEWYRIKRAPLVLGHEVTGEVVEVGSGVAGFEVGDRVFSTHHVPCDECADCLNGHHTACQVFHRENNFSPGGFAEYLRVGGRSIGKGTLRLPDEVSYEEGSFVEPLGTVVRGLREAEIRPGNSVLVIGSGLIGLMHIKLARALGAGRIIATDIHENRLQAATRFGADHTLAADADVPALVRQVNDGRLVDKVILCSGAMAAAETALASVEKGGTVLFFAVPKPDEQISVDINAFWRDSISIKVSYAAAPIDNAQALELIRSRRIRVDDMVTHRLPLDEIGEGFRLACSGAESLKVMIRPHG